MDRGAWYAIQSIGSQRVGHESTNETVLPLNSHGELPIFMFFYLKNFFMYILLYLFLTALRLVALGFLFLVARGGYSLIVFPGLLIAVASVVAEHGP